MDSEEYYDMEGGKRIKHKFLGQGLCCTVTPGLDCKEKTNNMLTK